MLKLFGAVLIIAAGAMAGFRQSSRYTNRPIQIRLLILALQRLETEISYGESPLPEALSRSGRGLNEPLIRLFDHAASRMNRPGSGSAMECWQEAVELMWRRSMLNLTEKDILLQLGITLGASGRVDQMKHLQLAVRQLQAEEVTAREEQQRYSKMWKSLGVLAGALVVILLY